MRKLSSGKKWIIFCSIFTIAFTIIFTLHGMNKYSSVDLVTQISFGLLIGYLLSLIPPVVHELWRMS